MAQVTKKHQELSFYSIFIL